MRDKSLTEMKNIKNRLLVSFGAQGLAIILRVIQQLLLVPILIYYWGSGFYQDWIIVFSASSLLAVVDFGTQAYFGNALLIAWSQNNITGFRRLFSVALWIYSVILLLSITVIMIISDNGGWNIILGTRVMSEDTTLWTFLPLTIATLGLVPIGVFTALYRVHGDYVHGTVFYVIADAGRGFGICLVAFWGGTTVIAAWVFFAIACLYWGVVLVDLRRRFGPIPWFMGMPSRSELREAVSGSSRYFIPGIVSIVILNIPIIVLGRLDDTPGAIVAFSVVRTFTGFVRQMVLQICFPIGFEMARQSALGEALKLKQIFVAGGRLTSGMAGILGGFTLVVADIFIRIWTHGSVSSTSFIVIIFLFTIIFMSPSQVASVFFQSNNKPNILVISHGVYSVSAIIFCVILVRHFSATGAAIGVGLAECVSVGILLPYAASRDISLPLGAYFARCYLVALCAFAASWAVAWAVQVVIAAQTIYQLGLLGIVWSSLILLPSYFLLLSATERSWLLREARGRMRFLK